MGRMPRVSIITPAHQSESLIGRAVASARAQTLEDWEMIVADDASADGTAAAAAASGDPRVRVVRSETNLGPAGARNLALDHATGDLIALLDADDQLLPRYLEVMTGLYDAGENVGLVACDAWLEGPDGRAEQTYGERLGFPDGAGLTELLEANTVFVAALAPRAVVEEVGRFSTECFGSEDHDLWLRILESGRRLVSTREVLAVYAVSGEGISADPLRMARTDATTFRRALARGRLTAEQRRIAQRRLRVARAAIAVHDVRAAAGAGRARAAARAVPAVAAAALSSPRELPRWTKTVLGA